MEARGRNVKLRVLLNLVIAAAVLGVAAFFLIPGARERVGLSPAKDAARGAADPAVHEDAAIPGAGAELVEEAAKVEEEKPAAEAAPLLRGRVTGEGQGIAGASVHLFSLKEAQATLDRLQALGEGGGMPHIPTLIASAREEFEKVKAAAVTATTAADGTYEFRRLEPDSYYVLAFADGWLFRYGDVVSLAPGRTETLDIELDRGAWIAGRVVGGNGAGLAGVAVTAEFRPGGSPGVGAILNRLLRYVNGEFLRGPFAARSGSDGSFRLASLPPGIYDVVAVGPNGIETRAAGIQTGAEEVLILLGKGASIRGLVTGTDGLPLAGLSFWLEREDEKLQLAGPLVVWGDVTNSVRRLIDEKPRRVVTGSRGEIQAGPLAPGSYRLFLESAGFLPFNRNLALDEAEKHDLGIIRLDGGESIAGAVLAEGGAPIEGASVIAAPAAVNFFNMGQAMDDFISGKKQTRTDASGAFRLSGLPQGEYRLQANARGYGGAEKKGVSTRGEPLTIHLQPGIQIAGRVLDAAGEPIPGAEVKARQARARSASDGRFLLAGVAPGADDVNPFGTMFGGMGSPPPPKSVTVKASATGYLEGRAELDLSAAKREADVVLKKVPEVLGRVVDGDLKPIPGCLVRLGPEVPENMPEFFDSSLIFVAAGVSDTEGKFRLSGYQASEGAAYRVIADHPSYARGNSSSFRFGAGAEEGAASVDVEVKLAAMAKVAGKVTDGEKGVAGATIRLSKAKENQGPQDFGAFMGMLGLPKGGERAYSGQGGAFRYERLAAGAYTLSAEVAGFTESAEVSVTVGAGEEREVTLIVDAGGEIAGVVADPTGAAIAGARVRLFREPDGEGEAERQNQMFEARKMFGGANKSARTGEDGSFRFDGLARGTYAIDARREGFSTGELKGVSPGDETHRIVLAPAATLRGTVADAASGEPIASFRFRFAVPGLGIETGMVEGWREVSDPDGRFARADLEPGEREVQVAAPGYAPLRKKLTVAAGAILEETFPLAAAGRIGGAITDLATGRPIAGARVSLAKRDDVPAGEAAAEGEEERSPERQRRRAARRRDGKQENESGGGENDDARAMGEHFAEAWGAASVTSREDGSFLFDDVPEGAHRLVVSHDRFIPEAREVAGVASGQELALDVRLREGLSLSGTVRDGSGKAIPGRFVFVRGMADDNAAVRKSALSGEDGAYLVRGLEKGAYRVVVPGGPGRPAIDGRKAIEVDLRADVSGFDVAVGEEE